MSCKITEVNICRIKGEDYKDINVNFTSTGTISAHSFIVQNNFGTVVKTINPTIVGDSAIISGNELESLDVARYNGFFWVRVNGERRLIFKVLINIKNG